MQYPFEGCVPLFPNSIPILIVPYPFSLQQSLLVIFLVRIKIMFARFYFIIFPPVTKQPTISIKVILLALANYCGGPRIKTTGKMDRITFLFSLRKHFMNMVNLQYLVFPGKQDSFPTAQVYLEIMRFPR